MQDGSSKIEKRVRRGRTLRAFVVSLVALLVTFSWAVSQWVKIPHHEWPMLFWLEAAPLVAVCAVQATILALPSLMPKRPFGGETVLVVPLLHTSLTMAVALLLTQRSSSLIELSYPQHFVAVWTSLDLLFPILGLEVTIIGLVVILDRALHKPVSSV